MLNSDAYRFRDGKDGFIAALNLTHAIQKNAGNGT